MKILFSFIVVLFSLSAWATPVDGEIFYKKKSGELVSRAVTLDVPSKGQGEVVLSGKNFRWATKDFWTTQANGQVLFTAAFQVEFMGKKSTIAFEGTYLKGSNKIIYQGDFFKRPGHDPVNESIADFTYNGGFRFKYDR